MTRMVLLSSSMWGSGGSLERARMMPIRRWSSAISWVFSFTCGPASSAGASGAAPAVSASSAGASSAAASSASSVSSAACGCWVQTTCSRRFTRSVMYWAGSKSNASVLTRAEHAAMMMVLMPSLLMSSLISCVPSWLQRNGADLTAAALYSFFPTFSSASRSRASPMPQSEQIYTPIFFSILVTSSRL